MDLDDSGIFRGTGIYEYVHFGAALLKRGVLGHGRGMSSTG